MDSGRFLFSLYRNLTLSYSHAYIWSLIKFGKSRQVMSNQEAVDSIKGVKDAKSAAKQLSEEAVARKSSDDISVVVVKFQ